MCTGVIIPPIPEKNVVQKYQMTQEFVSVRKQALQVFINRVVRPLTAADLHAPYASAVLV